MPQLAKPLLVAIIFLAGRCVALGQEKTYTEPCKLAKDILNYASHHMFDFKEAAGDSVAVILDVQNVLKPCFGDSIEIRGIWLRIINSGREVDRIRKYDIFASFRLKHLFVFTKERYNKFIVFRVYYPNSNGDVFWQFTKRKNILFLVKTSRGYF